MSNFGVKRDEHRNRPQPTRDPADTVTVARTGAPSRSTHQPRHDQANLKWVAPLIRRGFVSEACEVGGAGGVEGLLGCAHW
jgi:hypothetical protein